MKKVAAAPIVETAADDLRALAHNIAHELQPSLDLKALAHGNSDIIGFHAEAVVKRLIRRAVYPMRVSHGSVWDFPRKPLRQTDVILWSPYPAPAIYEVDDFAVVPRSNVFGVIEIKRSAYKGADKALANFVQAAPDLAWTPNVGTTRAGLGVVCVVEKNPSALMQSLLASGDVVAIFRKDKSGDVKVRTDDVLKLVNFLHLTTFRYRVKATTEVPQLNMTGED